MSNGATRSNHLLYGVCRALQIPFILSQPCSDNEQHQGFSGVTSIDTRRRVGEVHACGGDVTTKLGCTSEYKARFKTISIVLELFAQPEQCRAVRFRFIEQPEAIIM